MKKERLGLWVFWVVLLILIVPWLRIGARIQTNLREEMAKPFLPTEEFNRAVSQYQMIIKEDEKKLKAGAYSPKDFHQAIYTLFRLESGLCEKFNVPGDRKEVLESWRTNYGNIFLKQLYDKIIEKNQLPGFVMEKARQEFWQENGIKGALEGRITFTHFMKFLKWLLLFAWPISSVLAFFFFIYRCQVRGISFKELLIMNPLQVFAYSIFWLAGLAFNYPGDDLGVTRRYFKLKNRYLTSKSWGYRLGEHEENLLWQQARAPIDRFDRKVEQTIAYSRVMAFVSSLIIWIFVAPFRSLCTPVSQKEQVKVANKITEEQKKEKKSIIAEILGIDNFKLGGVVQLKRVKADNGSGWGKRVNLDGKVRIIKMENFELGCRTKIDLSKDNPALPFLSLESNFPWIGFVDKICIGRVFDPSLQGLPPHLMKTIEFPFHVGFPTDVGVSLSGHLGEFNWAMARLNGNGFSEWKDSNSAKDLVANLTWAPKRFLGIDEFTWRNVYRRGDKVSTGRRLILGSDISLKEGIFTVEGGLVLHREGIQKKDGGWLLGFVTIGKWQPLLQYDYQTEKGGRLTGGLNFLIDKNHRFQFNVEKTEPDTRFLFQYQVTF